MFIVISKELNVNGNISDLLEKYFKFLDKHEKQYAEEFDSKNIENENFDRKEKTDSFGKFLPCYKIIKSCLN